MIVKRIYILSFLLAVALRVTAQNAVPANDTVIKGASIEVVQSYKPEVKQVPKPQYKPTLPPADTSRLSFSYEVPQQTLYYTYGSMPLRPLALGKDSVQPPFPDYVKFGGGNLSTIYLDAGFGHFQGQDYETAIHLHHISQQGDIKNQQSALSGVEAEGILHRNGDDWRATLSAERNQYNYYGYNHSLYDYSSAQVKQTYTSIRANVDMRHQEDGVGKLNYDPSATISVYGAKSNVSEATFGFMAPFTYGIDTSLQAQLSLNAIFTQLSAGNVNAGNNIVMLTPGFNFHKEAFSGHLFLDPAVGKSGATLLEDMVAAYSIPKTSMTVSGGWQASLRQNTYEQLSSENPYIFQPSYSGLYSIQQTRKDEVFANILGSAGEHLSYSARASWWAYGSLPVFLSNYGDQKQFYILYDNVKAVSLQGNLRYQVANIFSAGVSAAYFNFNNGSLPHVWGEPATKLKGDLLFRPLTKLTITGYLAVLGGIYEKDIYGNTLKLKPVLDIGGSAEYALLDRLSVFLQINNIFDNKYQRWLGYQAYGINIYGGLRLKF